MSTSRPSIQTAAQRRSVEIEVDKLIAKFAFMHLRLIDSVRRWLGQRLPTSYELVYPYRSWFVISYSPNENGYEGVLAIRVNADGLKLYFNRGKELADPAKMLRGSGKQTRWIPLEDVSTLACSEVESLIDQAIALSRVPFASTGRGPLILRSSSAK